MQEKVGNEVNDSKAWSIRTFQHKRRTLLSDMRAICYWHMHRYSKGKREPRWRGIRVVKYPNDMILYAEAIFANKPDWIVEIGTRFGGSAVFFGDMISLANPNGKVLSIDIRQGHGREHPKVEFVTGSSNDPMIVEYIRNKVGDGKVMVSLDGDHREECVRKELVTYGNITTSGQYMVAEDCHTYYDSSYGPGLAVNWYLTQTKEFTRTNPEDRFLTAVTRDGWLLKT